MAEPYRQEVRELELVTDMDVANFEALMRGAYVQNFPPRIELNTEGESPDLLHSVLPGSLDLFSA